MSIELTAVDMDGTFLSSQETYNRERFMAQYQQTKAQGIRFVVASGNQYYQLISFFPEVISEIAFVVENSGWVVSEGKDTLNGKLPKDAFTTVVEHLLTYPEVEIIAHGRNSAYTLKKYGDTMKTVVRVYYHRLEYVDNFDSLEDIFFKFGLSSSDELISQIQKTLYKAVGDIMVPAHTDNGSVDLITPDVYRTNGLRQLQKLRGTDDSEVVVLGDGGNDIEMPRQVDFSFAMEDAGSAVVVAAKYRAGSNNCEGVPDVISRVLKHEAPSNQ